MYYCFFFFFFSSLGNQHRTVQQKKLKFGTIAVIEVSCSIFTLALAIVLALNGYGIFSLVYSTLFNVMSSNILFLFVGLKQDGNIYFHFSVNETIPYLKIGSFSIGTQILDFFSREIDVIIISATLGKDTLGVYSLCKRLVTALYSSITPIYSKVLTPLISSLQNNKKQIHEVFYNAIETICLINFPIFLAVAIGSSSIIYVFYGEQYLEGSLVLAILAVHYGYLSKGNPDGCLQVAYGRTDVGFYWTIFRIIIFSIATYIGALFSVECMAFSIFLAAQVSTPIGWYFSIYLLIHDNFWDYYKISMRPFVIAVLVAVPFYWLFGHMTAFVYVSLGIVLYFLIYAVITYYLFSKSYAVKKAVEFIHFLTDSEARKISA